MLSCELLHMMKYTTYNVDCKCDRTCFEVQASYRYVCQWAKIDCSPTNCMFGGKPGLMREMALNEQYSTEHNQSITK